MSLKNRKTIVRITTWMAAVASLSVMCVLPLSYFIFSYQYVRGSLVSEVETSSRLVTAMINANPTLWHFEEPRLAELLAKRPVSGESESRRIVDLSGGLIAGSDTHLLAPLVMVSHDVLDAGLVVARIEIGRSLRPLRFRTGIAALISFFIGLTLFVTLRILPIRAVIEAEKALRETGDFLSRLMQSTTNAIVVIDPNGRISHVNQRCEEISGYSQDELLGQPFSRLFEADEFILVWRRLDTLNTRDEPLLGMEAKWLRREGGLVPLSWGGALLPGQDGLNSIVFTAEDISKLKQDQEEKEKIIGELQRALAEIQTLRGIIPICAYCKKIRNEEGVWRQLEVYIRDHSSAEFSHGLCPECFEKQMAAIDD